MPLARLASLVKFEHTVFALPFAFMSAVVAAGGIPSSRIILLILAAMVGARTAAMTFNRIADVEFDRANPRTAKRELVTGAVSTAQAWALLLASCALFLWAAWQINRLALMLAPVALAIVLGYSYTKRFTVLSHAILGLALAIAPVGAWVAVRAEIGFPSLILAASVLAWRTRRAHCPGERAARSDAAHQPDGTSKAARRARSRPDPGGHQNGPGRSRPALERLLQRRAGWASPRAGHAEYG